MQYRLNSSTLVFGVSVLSAACFSSERAIDLDSDNTSLERGSKDRARQQENLPLPSVSKSPGRVYAHTKDTLYLFDPIGDALTKIGSFACLEESDRMLDIALDRDGVMYGTSDWGFLRIDPVGANCSYVTMDWLYPNSLAFVPVGTVDPTKEALVGYAFNPDTGEATDYVRLDLGSGQLEKVGDLNPPGASTLYKSSGDLVAMIRSGKAYLTVRQLVEGEEEEDESNDFLAEIDPSTGTLKRIIGDVGQKFLYGLAQWEGTAYGFNELGNVIAIDMTSGAARTLRTLKDGDEPIAWFGAGVTTDSPTSP